ncbi:hypothetical protein TPHA_0C01490 [Tetrapisispora phaffii CBS 4417]|uniref:Uncharacterized protein n=1 Tax=Tetrapisispora phaffii (strain ATCC 24235 / CBS 4417 / NBRC 1672 / NRRL Y-8282 / UCD 70-5) TaxID=1071381 RepID=G8BRC9_TETPH|nr:hypothetical protein TPHA_0C01490 [Tetrapisispora phaffii CBS 4417]CCE62305.1 hypothetical protein TPHA_0C01490 [Tetrapisispora phaffii CBS 4417]
MPKSRSLDLKPIYPLRMETIPLSDKVKELSGSSQSATNVNIFNEGEAHSSENRAKTYESDDSFKFKRHKSNQKSGVPTLGERLDNFQDIQKAKWMENFNSSMPEYQNNRDDTNSDNGVDKRSSQNFKGAHTPSQQPYVPYVYYYPVPSSSYPMLPYNSPQMHENVENPQMRNGASVPMYYAPQPGYYPEQPYMFSQDSNVQNRLMPAPQLFPQYHSMNPNSQLSQKSKDRRKSIADQRGRRVSRIFTQDEHLGIISPHKDVPAQDFYRHIGNSSFGRDLQIRQLFNWCSIRSLHNLEKEADPKYDSDKRNRNGMKNEIRNYDDSKIIAISILKEFVNDLRKDKININWDDTMQDNSDDDYSAIEGDDIDSTFDEHIFDDTEDIIKTGNNAKKEIKKSAKRRSRKDKKEKVKIANIKNIENQRNLNLLDSKIDKYKLEMDNWSDTLKSQDWEAEWDALEKEVELMANDENMMSDAENLPFQIFEDKFFSQIDKLSSHAILLEATTKALSELTMSKTEMLSHEFNKHNSFDKTELNSKALLMELSNALNK